MPKRKIERSSKLVDGYSPSNDIIYFDGACIPNPGRMGAGVYSLALPRIQYSSFVGRGTNNLAEWHALALALTTAEASGKTSICIYGDSKLVVEQINGRWAINDDDHYGVACLCKHIIDKMDAVSIEWIPRKQNTEADRLANRALE